MHLHANVVRFERSPIQASRSASSGRPNHIGASSFAIVLKGNNTPVNASEAPAMVIDNSCVVTSDLEFFVMGRVKKFSFIPNLRVLLSNEGFQNVKVVYLGGLWVMFELESLKSKAKFMQHVDVASWFTCLCNAQSDFVSRERIVWVDIEESKDDLFARKRICIKTKQEDNILENFKIIVKGKNFVIRAKELFAWSPVFKDVKEVEYCIDDESVQGTNEDKGEVSNKVKQNPESDDEGVSDTFGESEENLSNKHNSKQPMNDKEKSQDPFNFYDLLRKRDGGGLCSRVLEEVQHTYDLLSSGVRSNGHIPKKGGSVLEVLDEMIKVGQTMGYTMEGIGSKAKKDWTRELIGKYKVNFLSLQETKMESISEMDVKILWGNSNFEYLFSEAIGNSGGTLCTWDPNIFLKEQHILSDNFVALFSTWIPIKTKLLMISIYAPQPRTDKRSLCNYIMSLVTRWQGDSIVMGDFNEVRSADERIGSVFNIQRATDFNDFISNSRLVDIQLEDYSFTWSHPSASKMSKLDRFPVTEGRRNDMKLKLSVIDKQLDQGRVNDDNLLSRMGLMKQLLDTIREVMVDGEWVDDPRRVKEEFCSHFATRFHAPSGIRNKINFLFPNQLSSDQAFELEKQVSTDEIRTAVWACGENKSRGPDGFTFEFFCKFWDTIGPDLCLAVEWFFDHGSFCKGCNSSFIALIPKVQDSKFVNDYHPISMIRSLYKVVTKILALRLSSVIAGLISDVQTTFLPNDVLQSFGFGLKWRSWILGSLSSGMASVLVNGSPTAEFQFHCGLKQGVGIPNDLIVAAASTLGCLIMKTPFKYLGVTVGGSSVLVNAEDRWFWDLNGNGVFYVKDVRKLLDESFLPKEATATRWRNGQMLAFDGHCTMAADVTRLVCRWWDLVWSPLGSYSEWLSWFNSIRLGSNLKSMLEGVFFVTRWCLWNFKNRLLFAAQKSRKD
nr:RNA-directed DNA polymerase, eukaryota [Tanacetum cinerariifolium]